MLHQNRPARPAAASVIGESQGIPEAQGGSGSATPTAPATARPCQRERMKRPASAQPTARNGLIRVSSA